MQRRFEQIFVDATDTLLRVRGSVGALYAPVARRHGFEIESHKLELYGRCSGCRRGTRDEAKP